jgi:hypothetical protein
LRGHRIQRRGMSGKGGGGGTTIPPGGRITPGGSIAAAIVLDELADTVADTGSVDSGGNPAIIGPSMGSVGRIDSGQAEVSVAGGKTSDNGRKLSSPGSQQGPKSLWHPLFFSHSLLLVPLFES